jgi:hypothetical protein
MSRRRRGKKDQKNNSSPHTCSAHRGAKAGSAKTSQAYYISVDDDFVVAADNALSPISVSSIHAMSETLAIMYCCNAFPSP